MIDLQPVMDALRVLPAIRKVADAASAIKAMDGNIPTPDGVTAFVIPLAETGGSPISMDPVTQAGRQELAVVLQIRVAGDASGAAGVPKLPDLTKAIRAALIGLMPPGAAGPIEFVDARLEDMRPGALWWTERYALSTFIAG